ncbi:MAG TPA: hypothetical protein VEV81_05935 [Pyrinomonadaceae bacterium]|nr:hypothetical protein [Pyrinomonadaceae bacterium]
MSEEKWNQLPGEETGRKSFKVAVIVFSIVEALVVIFGIVYKNHH